MDTDDRRNLDNQDEIKVKKTRTRRVTSRKTKDSSESEGKGPRKQRSSSKQTTSSSYDSIWNSLGMSRKEAEKIHNDFLKTLNIDPSSLKLSDVFKDCEKYGVDGIFKR